MHEQNYYTKYLKYKQKYINLRLYNSFLPSKLKQEYKIIKYQLENEFTNYPNSTKTIQTGGGSKMHNWMYKNKIYTFNINTINYKDTIDISLISKSEQDCIMASISKKNKFAIIVNISYFDDCAQEGSISPGGGDKLLRFMLDYLKKNNQKYNINRIILKDNSILYCNNCSDNIKLSQLRTVTHGGPWYIKYGFKFYNSKIMEPDNRYILEINNNIKIIKNLKISEIDIKKIITNIYKYEKKYINKKQLLEIFELSQKYTYVREFIINLCKNFNKNCCVIKYLLDYMYKGGIDSTLKLFDFNGMNYYLDI